VGDTITPGHPPLPPFLSRPFFFSGIFFGPARSNSVRRHLVLRSHVLPPDIAISYCFLREIIFRLGQKSGFFPLATPFGSSKAAVLKARPTAPSLKGVAIVAFFFFEGWGPF